MGELYLKKAVILKSIFIQLQDNSIKHLYKIYLYFISCENWKTYYKVNDNPSQKLEPEKKMVCLLWSRLQSASVTSYITEVCKLKVHNLDKELPATLRVHTRWEEGR